MVTENTGSRRMLNRGRTDCFIGEMKSPDRLTGFARDGHKQWVVWVRFIFSFKNFGHQKREDEANLDQGEDLPMK
jgi:hypothetical protein